MTPEMIAFYTALSATVSGVITFITRGVLKSNCVRCSCCGAECVRATTHEKNELELNSVAI